MRAEIRGHVGREHDRKLGGEKLDEQDERSRVGILLKYINDFGIGIYCLLSHLLSISCLPFVLFSTGLNFNRLTDDEKKMMMSMMSKCLKSGSNRTHVSACL